MDNRGFTLTELMVAVSITSVLFIAGALGYSNFTTLTQQKLARRQAEQVKAALLKARNLALTSLDCVDAQVTSHQITITRYHTCGPMLANPVSTEVVAIGELVDLTDPSEPSTSNITFTASGGTLQPNARVVAKSGDGRVYRYIVLPAMGMVRNEI